MSREKAIMLRLPALLSLTILFLVSSFAFAASDTATISGRITEQSGAVLAEPGAEESWHGRRRH